MYVTLKRCIDNSLVINVTIRINIGGSSNNYACVQKVDTEMGTSDQRKKKKNTEKSLGTRGGFRTPSCRETAGKAACGKLRERKRERVEAIS